MVDFFFADKAYQPNHLTKIGVTSISKIRSAGHVMSQGNLMEIYSPEN